MRRETVWQEKALKQSMQELEGRIKDLTQQAERDG